MKRSIKIIISVAASIAFTVSVTLLVVNVDEVILFKQEITNNITNSRGNANRQKDRTKYAETNKNRKSKSTIDKSLKSEQDTTIDTTKNEEIIFAEEDI